MGFTVAGGPAVFETVHPKKTKGLALVCESVTGQGEASNVIHQGKSFTGTVTLVRRLSFKGCQGSEGRPYETEGEPEGVIVTKNSKANSDAAKLGRPVLRGRSVRR